jgi:hypothetical protein
MHSEYRAQTSREVAGTAHEDIEMTRTSIPNLGLDRFVVALDAPRGEFYADGRLGFEVELVSRKPRQQVTLTDARVSDQHHWGEQEGGKMRKKRTLIMPRLITKRAHSTPLLFLPTIRVMGCRSTLEEVVVFVVFAHDVCLFVER